MQRATLAIALLGMLVMAMAEVPPISPDVAAKYKELFGSKETEEAPRAPKRQPFASASSSESAPLPKSVPGRKLSKDADDAFSVVFDKLPFPKTYDNDFLDGALALLSQTTLIGMSGLPAARTLRVSLESDGGEPLPVQTAITNRLVEGIAEISALSHEDSPTIAHLTEVLFKLLRAAALYASASGFAPSDRVKGNMIQSLVSSIQLNPTQDVDVTEVADRVAKQLQKDYPTLEDLYKHLTSETTLEKFKDNVTTIFLKPGRLREHGGPAHHDLPEGARPPLSDEIKEKIARKRKMKDEV